jgi:hypothetical protein
MRGKMNFGHWVLADVPCFWWSTYACFGQWTWSVLFHGLASTDQNRAPPMSQQVRKHGYEVLNLSSKRGVLKPTHHSVANKNLENLWYYLAFQNSHFAHRLLAT